MPSSGAALQPVEVPQLRCPRCWFPAPFLNLNGSIFRCARCEWKFTLAAPTLAGAPAFPATTVAVTNPYATPIAATITLNGATIASFTISGTAAGALTAGTYIIPAGGTFAAAYTVASPTWAWALPGISAGVSAGGAALTFAPTGTQALPFAVGQALIVDPAGTSDVVVVSGTPTATSVPVRALNAAHLTGVLVTVAQVTVAHASVETVPLTSY
jgi:hypothetical protein